MEMQANARARAWIMIHVESPHETAHSLYDALKDEGGDCYVLVRADVVDHHFNLVIPVDASDALILQGLYQTILAHTGAEESEVLRVIEHVPFPPHDAQGYISDEERELGDPNEMDRIRPGRQASSPGWNAWG